MHIDGYVAVALDVSSKLWWRDVIVVVVVVVVPVVMHDRSAGSSTKTVADPTFYLDSRNGYCDPPRVTKKNSKNRSTL